MKHTVHRMFWNYENEEKWLNEMSAKGLALTDYSWRRYVFEETPKNQYIYRIELLEQLPDHPESMAYIHFMEENGVEYVTSSTRWVYFRKKSSDGAFDIYSDIESQIKYFNRIFVLWNTLMFTELIIGLVNIIIGVANRIALRTFSFVNLILGGILILFGMVFMIFRIPIRKKIKKLQREKMITE